jgi:Holliday junction resolvase
MTYRDDNGQSLLEVDLLVINGTVGILIECKSHASIDDVNEHLERLLAFRQYFTRYADLTLHAAIAAMVIPDDVARYAYRKGMYVMVQNGESIDIRNDDTFTPRVW